MNTLAQTHSPTYQPGPDRRRRTRHRRPWIKPRPLNAHGRWVWAFVPHRTGSGVKWMCWLWRYSMTLYRHG